MLKWTSPGRDTPINQVQVAVCSSLALMVNWTSWQLASPVNQVQPPLCATFLFSFFLLIIVLQIQSAILEDGAWAGNQSYLAKNNCTTFCNLVHRFHRITAKTRPTLPWKGSPNKQYCQQNDKEVHLMVKCTSWWHDSPVNHIQLCQFWRFKIATSQLILAWLTPNLEILGSLCALSNYADIWLLIP